MQWSDGRRRTRPRVPHTFKRGDADVLVSTSIIENGIDIPNANTILIDRATALALLNCIKCAAGSDGGTAGPLPTFSLPSVTRLPELSRKRLSALIEASGYGGGMKLAMRDLEIRGAGDLLGLEQSGIGSVGFHLYWQNAEKDDQDLAGQTSGLYDEVKDRHPL